MIRDPITFVAAVCIKTGTSCTPLQNVTNTNPDTAVSGILGIVYWLAGIVAVIAIIIGGLFYITSAGNPQKAAQARTMIISAVVGLIVVVSAFTITQFVLGGI